MKRQPGMARARVIGLFLLLSTPYFLLPSHSGVAGLTNAPACVALGLLIGSAIMLAHALRPALAYPERMRVIFCVVGVAIAAAFAVPEWVGAITLLLTTYETAGRLIALAAPFYSDVHMSLGYWPLAVSALLLTLATPELLDDLGYEQQSPSQTSVTSTGDECAREPNAPLVPVEVLLAAALAGAIRTPALVTMVHAGQPMACCLVAMQACLAALVIHAFKHATRRRAYGVLACYALGSVVWDCASRIWPLLTPFFQTPLAAFIGLACACAICLALALIPTAQKPGKKGTPAAADDDPHEDRCENPQPELLECRSIANSEVNANEEDSTSAKDVLSLLAANRDLSALTPGELDCVRLLLEGQTQQDVAKHLGKAPSTVRVLLSRSYKKLDVHSAAELRALARAQQETANRASASREAQLSDQRANENPSVSDNPSANSKSPAGSSFRSIWEQLQLPLRVALLVLLCIPYGSATLSWGSGHLLILALGLGLLCSGVLRLVSTRTQPRQFKTEAQRRAAQVVFFLLGLAPIALSEAESVGPLWKYMGRLALPWLLAIPTLLFGMAWALWPNGLNEFTHQGQPRPSLTQACLVPAILATVATISPICRVPLSIACLIATAFAGPESREETKATHRTGQGHSLSPMLAIAAAIGFTCEEAWRSLGGPSVLAATIPFCIALIVGSLLVLRSQDNSIRYAAALALICILFGAGGAQIELARIAFCFGASAFLLAETAHSQSASFVLPSFGVGMLVGNVGINTYGDFLLHNEISLAFIGGKLGLVSSVGFLLGVGFTAAGAALVLYCIKLANLKRALDSNLLDDTDSTARERAKSLLSARGLNSTQIDVLLEIAAGKDIGQISEDLNYSRGTVNSARLAGYRKLELHSRQQLIEYISAGTKLVNTR